jgi:hypothetical protein
MTAWYVKLGMTTDHTYSTYKAIIGGSFMLRIIYTETVRDFKDNFRLRQW